MNTPESAPVVHRSRTRRFVRWLVVTVVASFVAVTLWNLVRRELTRVEGNRELAAAVAEAERDDPNWTWEKLNAARPRPPEGKNSAELIPKIKAASHADWGKWQTKDEWKAQLDAPPNVWYSPKLLAEVRRDLSASADAVALARTLKNYPTGNRDLVLAPYVLDTSLKDTNDTRHAADLLRWDTAVALEDGDSARAVDNLSASLNASRSIGDEPFLISQLIRIAVRTVTIRTAQRTLAQTTALPDLTSFQIALAADAEEPLLLFGVRGERAAYSRLIGNLANGTLPPDQAAHKKTDTLWGKAAWWHYRVRLLKDYAFYLSWMTTATQAARLPMQEQPVAVAALPGPPDETLVMARLLLPAVDKVAGAQFRSTAETRCAVVGIACERFRQKHSRWPNDLTELVPGFLSAVPLDPYSGEPLRFAKSADGCVVYSVGKDRRGDGQFDAPDSPERVRFRLWNPDRRRLPAPPDPLEPAADP